MKVCQLTLQLIHIGVSPEYFSSAPLGALTCFQVDETKVVFPLTCLAGPTSHGSDQNGHVHGSEPFISPSLHGQRVGIWDVAGKM